MKITIKNHGEIEVKEGEDLIAISTDLGFDKVVVALVNATPKDLSYIPEDGDAIEFLGFDHKIGREVFWHSTSHLMASAVKRLYPSVKLGIGPATDDGFYYDFLTDKPFSEDDIVRIEDEMRKIRDENPPFKRVEMTKGELRKILKDEDEFLKLELLDEIEGESVLGYYLGDFFDMCRGPHIPLPSYIGAFKLLSVAGAYWRGDETKPMLSRIYGISFPTEEELDKHLALLEEAKKRDHRLIGKELEIFSIDEQAGAGLVFWHPKGAIIRNIIEHLWIEEHIKRGYQIVSTPHILRDTLFRTSGHYDFYIENMFTLNVDNVEYVLKPMNCPGHFVIFMSKTRSYKDLPIRYAELGTVYRKERSGTLHGLLRVRGFTIDDAHIFCTPEQIADEVKEALKFSIFFMETFGFGEYHIELSVRDPLNKDKYAGTDEAWEQAENSLLNASQELGFEPLRIEGEAVFYGPKIDIKLHDALGRIWQSTTIQFDFNLPQRFGAVYIDKDGTRKEVVVIHRALLGSMERFIGALIEHYAGIFPLWLAPEQVRILPISERFIKYANNILNKLKDEKIRAILDERDVRIQQKIRDAEIDNIPYMLIIGAKEEEGGCVSVRKKLLGDVGQVKLNEFISEIKDEIENKRLSKE
ncbi:MAG: threonine--tRNA ligase [bacterium]